MPTGPSTTEARISSSHVREATGGKGVDVILDMVAGDYTERNIVAAAPEGRIVQIAVLGGATSSSTSPA